MAVEAKLEGDINKFYDQASKDIGALISGAAVGSAVIFNGTSQPVTFYVYNYIDTAYWVPAQKTLIASGKYGPVAASGNTFKVHPNNNHDHEFLVEPGAAYVYGGPGDLTKAK